MGMVVKDEIIKILPSSSHALKVAYIVTASNLSSNKGHLNNERTQLQNMGLSVIDVDMVGKDENALRRILTPMDIIYVQGGNIFYLLNQVRLSGFDNVVKELVEKGVIYIGVSAGSYIACPSIIMGTWRSPHMKIDPLRDFSGLSLVPFLVAAHYEEKYYNLFKRGMLNETLKLKVINNHQALLIKENGIFLVGDKTEIMIS